MAVTARRRWVQVSESVADGGGLAPSLLEGDSRRAREATVVARFVRRADRTARGCREQRDGFASITAPGPLRGQGYQRGYPGKAGPVMTLASAPAAPSVERVPAWRNAVTNIGAGATAGAAVEAALYPLDTLKTRLQTMTSGGGLKALISSGGGKALYTGLLGNLAGVVPASAIFMGVYEPVKCGLQERLPVDRQVLAPLVGGLAAGLAASVVRVPTEVVKQRLQTGEFRSAVTAVKTILAREGARGLFAGYGSFLLRDLPFDAIEFVAYEQLKKAYQWRLVGRSELSATETSAVGAVAGAITGVLTTPLDVIKTRLMTQGSSGRYASIADCASKIIREEGLATMFRGWEPRVLWIGVGGSVFFTALEEAKKLYAPKPN